VDYDQKSLPMCISAKKFFISAKQSVTTDKPAIIEAIRHPDLFDSLFKTQSSWVGWRWIKASNRQNSSWWSLKTAKLYNPTLFDAICLSGPLEDSPALPEWLLGFSNMAKRLVAGQFKCIPCRRAKAISYLPATCFFT